MQNKLIDELNLNINAVKKESLGGHRKDELINALRIMQISRAIDDRAMKLLKQGRTFFHMESGGHEAVQTAFGLNLKKGFDWAFPYYRDLSFMLSLGIKPENIFLHLLARKDDQMSGGRQMPCHWGVKELNIPSQSSPTGTQFLQAVGTAMANKKNGINAVTYVSSGEGTTSEGEFFEAVNWASREKLPVVFLIQNNKWAISVPVENQNAGKNASVAELLKGFENLYRQNIDGTDFLASNAAAISAYKYARSGRGPALVEADVVRLGSHSSSDDQKKYRPAEHLEDEQERCPLKQLSELLIKNNILTELEYSGFIKEIEKEVKEAAEWALMQAPPDKKNAARFVIDESGMRNKLDYNKPGEASKPIVMVDAINHALHEEMKRNDKIYIYGEDVADSKGGVFTATKGLSTRFGNERVFNSPLAEASIAGTAIGMALAGLKPCIEIQFGDYIWPAFMQYRNEMAAMRYRSNNQFDCSIVTRVPIGGYIHGGLYHSQNIEGFFAHIPGIFIAYPSNAEDAKGLLKTALRINDPVLFLEHKGLYRQSYAMSPEPDADYLLPFGKANIVTKGDDMTVITYGAMVHESNFAIKKLVEEGYSIELIDLRTIAPLDEETIFASVRKTGKAVVIHEDSLTAGFGAEIASQIAENCFEYLDCPVKRIAAADTPIPYSPDLENEILPNREKLYSEILKILNY
ncbi:MAG: tungsten formylmethanofuran dehydrogenase [Ignavibacteria bacterium]|nr:tungsten formylmethanofuran dehydrogenase [Ignavibacteria bacterium]